MQHYVTAILLAVPNSVEIPLAIALGAGESYKLYEQFHVAFCQLCDMDLRITSCDLTKAWPLDLLKGDTGAISFGCRISSNARTSKDSREMRPNGGEVNGRCLRPQYD
jgi:hypothetical protein